jgi:hypothetical protein
MVKGISLGALESRHREKENQEALKQTNNSNKLYELTKNPGEWRDPSMSIDILSADLGQNSYSAPRPSDLGQNSYSSAPRPKTAYGRTNPQFNRDSVSDMVAKHESQSRQSQPHQSQPRQSQPKSKSKSWFDTIPDLQIRTKSTPKFRYRMDAKIHPKGGKSIRRRKKSTQIKKTYKKQSRKTRCRR